MRGERSWAEEGRGGWREREGRGGAAGGSQGGVDGGRQVEGGGHLRKKRIFYPRQVTALHLLRGSVTKRG